MIAAGEEPKASMILFDSVAVTNRGTFIPKALYERSLAIWEEALGPDHPKVAQSLENMAQLYRKIG
jgi:hypothetical protein